MAIFNPKRPTPIGYAAVHHAVKASDTKHHASNNIGKRSVELKRVSPLGPTRNGRV